MAKQHFILCCIFLSSFFTACRTQQDAPLVVTQPVQKPNILFIMADDLGYSDIGAFGGEIHTPNLDALAQEGRLLSDYHTAPTCSPTRAQLISGVDHHLAGLGAMAELTPSHLKGQPGYEGYLNEQSLSIAGVLHDHGYRTYISGKWHLGLTDSTNAKARGFDRSFTLLQGYDLHFKSTPVGYTRNATYTEDGRVVTIDSLPDNFYSTDYYTDKLLEYLKADQKSGKPFFAYAAYTAPHWPIQAPLSYRNRYLGVYDAGYDAVRAARIAKQKQLGLIPKDFVAAEPVATVHAPYQAKTWDALSAQEKALEARNMEIYAGMVENLDYNIGRLIQYLKANHLYDNTLIFFVSDNGAEGFIRSKSTTAQLDNSLTGLGTEHSYTFIGPRWAEVSAAPFHLWKDTAGEGATTAPAIVRLPYQNQVQPIQTQFTSVLDIFPTILDYAQVNVPKGEYKGRRIHTPSGYSWKAMLENKAQQIRPQGFWFADELHGNKYVKQGNWKIAQQNNNQLGSGRWELYHLNTDRAENHDVSEQHPEKVQELLQLYRQYAKTNGVQECQIP